MRYLFALLLSVLLSSNATAKSIYWVKTIDGVKSSEIKSIFKTLEIRKRVELKEINWISFESENADDLSNEQLSKILSSRLISQVTKSVTFKTFGRENDPKGTPGKKVDARTAWDQTVGDKRIVVAVSDTGVNLNHEDLKNQIWVNRGEIAGNGVDDDRNGYIDDVNGWNFYSNTNNPNDDHGHGSNVAGIIGAEGNNGIGIAGVNWHVTIMPLKFISSRGSGTDEGGAQTIIYAANNGADIINASWGGGDFSQVLYDAVEYAGKKGVLFVAAAGNDGKRVERNPMLPAGFDLDSIVSVASGARPNSLSKFSNFGKTVVDIMAPGEQILSAYKSKENAYKAMSGTSMASPVVAGVAALMLSVEPSLTLNDLRNGLLSSAKPTRRNSTASGGWLMASKAVSQLNDAKEIWPQRLSIKVGQNHKFTARRISGTWSIENSAIANVNNVGVVQGLAEGTTRVVLTDSAGNQYTTVYLDVVE